MLGSKLRSKEVAQSTSGPSVGRFTSLHKGCCSVDALDDIDRPFYFGVPCRAFLRSPPSRGTKTPQHPDGWRTLADNISPRPKPCFSITLPRPCTALQAAFLPSGGGCCLPSGTMHRRASSVISTRTPEPTALTGYSSRLLQKEEAAWLRTRLFLRVILPAEFRPRPFGCRANLKSGIARNCERQK